jgi:hypothetical protein
MITSHSIGKGQSELDLLRSKISGTAFNYKESSNTHIANVKIGMDAAMALWEAAADKSLWLELNRHPLYGCILATQALVEVLAELGRKDAKIRLLGFELVRYSDVQPRSLTIGASAAPVLPGYTNAHAVVTLGDVLIDPSHAQIKRDWNDQPSFVSFPLETPFPAESVHDGSKVHGVARAYWGAPTALMQYEFEALYFELLPDVRKRARGWKSAPDLRSCRREGIVKRAVEILKSKS